MGKGLGGRRAGRAARPHREAARRSVDMSSSETTVVDLEAMVEIAQDGIVSKAIVENDHHKIIHFSFAQGQELSEHTASVPATIHILKGAGTVVLDGERHAARPGCLYYMPANLRHAVVADEELAFLLTMFRT
jgi:quercetin dioxygenase-like cupin family protein